MRFNVYKWNLFDYQGPSSFSYNPKTEQDVKFIEDQREKYFLVFKNRRGRTLFDGDVIHGSMAGSVSYYRSNKNLKKTEYYGYYSEFDTTINFEWTDIRFPVGKWDFFDRKGKLLKQITYLTLTSNFYKYQTYWYVRRTSYFKGIRKSKFYKDKIIDTEDTQYH
ncbi:MAG: hypothetical protein WAR83_15735 [Flavobacteriales bacterium]